MAIYNYSEESTHPDAKGIRVVVTVGSETLQRYFATEEKEKAKKWEATQLKKRDAYNRKMDRVRAPNANQGLDYTKTGVKGLRINVKKAKGRKGQPYYRCVISININSNITGEKVSKSLIITGQSLQKKWYEACKLLSKHKDRSTVSKNWLDQCPTTAEVNRMIKGYKQNKLLLDIGFNTLPRSKYPSTRSDVIIGH